MRTTDFDMTDTRVVLIDADPATVLGAVERLELARPVMQAIASLGLADRIALAPTRLDTDHACTQRYGMAWGVDAAAAEVISPHDLMAFDGAGVVKVVWDVQIAGGGNTGSILSIKTRIGSTDSATRERLAAAYGIVGPLAAALTKRALAAVKRHAENQDDLPSLATVELAPTRGHSSTFMLAA